MLTAQPTTVHHAAGRFGLRVACRPRDATLRPRAVSLRLVTCHNCRRRRLARLEQACAALDAEEAA